MTVYWPTKPGQKTRCDKCLGKPENCWECMIDDLLDAQGVDS
jgi:hypothetical protein